MAGVDDAPGEVVEVRPQPHLPDDLPGQPAHRAKGQIGEEQRQQYPHRHHRRHNLVAGEGGGEQPDGQRRRPVQHQPQIAGVDGAGVRAGEHEQQHGVEQRQGQQRQKERQRRQILAQHYLPVAHRRRQQQFDGAQFLLLGDEAHRQRRGQQDEDDDGAVEERGQRRLRERVAQVPRKEEPGQRQKDEAHDVGGRAEEVKLNFLPGHCLDAPHSYRPPAAGVPGDADADAASVGIWAPRIVTAPPEWSGAGRFPPGSSPPVAAAANSSRGSPPPAKCRRANRCPAAPAPGRCAARPHCGA